MERTVGKCAVHVRRALWACPVGLSQTRHMGPCIGAGGGGMSMVSWHSMVPQGAFGACC